MLGCRQAGIPTGPPLVSEEPGAPDNSFVCHTDTYIEPVHTLARWEGLLLGWRSSVRWTHKNEKNR